eukprot:SAG31_NODE_13569_length_860_cov_1.873850_1_plen_162_part_01
MNVAPISKQTPHPLPRQPNEGWATRHTQILLLVLCSAINYADRVNISIAIVDMAAAHGWSLKTQALVMSSFFWGYICSQVFGALLAQRYGGKLVLGTAGLAWSALTVLTPVAANAGMLPLLLCRVLLGVSEGCLIPVNSVQCSFRLCFNLSVLFHTLYSPFV